MRASTTLLAELIDGEGRVDPERWRIAHRDQSPVALCRCGGLVHPDPDEAAVRRFYGVDWYAMRCASCGHETEVNGTRVMPTTGRTSLALLEEARAVEARRYADA